MKKLQCLIVEDEPLAAEVITDYVMQIPFLSLAGTCTNALQALEMLRKKKIDVIFLDLHLPGIKGFELLKTLTHRPQVIITTAYHEYALQSYDWQVIDYLVKPVEFSRFVSAVNKLKATREVAVTAPAPAPPRFILLYADKKSVRVAAEQILYVESEKDYMKVVTDEKTIVVRQTLQELEEMLPPDLFVRVHRSFLVAKNRVTAFSALLLEIGGKTIPIGRQYRDQVLAILKQG
jgi:DNA-binding LytR/AlgR family response regulator